MINALYSHQFPNVGNPELKTPIDSVTETSYSMNHQLYDLLVGLAHRWVDRGTVQVGRGGDVQLGLPASLAPWRKCLMRWQEASQRIDNPLDRACGHRPRTGLPHHVQRSALVQHFIAALAIGFAIEANGNDGFPDV